jgi:hypothetical protein
MDNICTKSVLIIYICLQTFIISIAQEQKQHEKKYYVDENEKLFWNRKLPVYIRIASSPEDTGYIMKSEVTKQYSNPYYFDAEGYHRIRTDWATDQKTGEMVYPQLEVIWEAYADGIAPESKLIFSKSPKSSKGAEEIYGDSVTIEIHAKDATAGVDQIYYSLNGDDYKLYTAPFVLSSEGYQKVKYYTVDKVGNAEKPKEKNFNTDLKPPKTYYTIAGISNNEIIAVNTKITLSAEDSLSGLRETYYKIDSSEFVVYKPGTYIPISKLSDGDHKLVFYSVDKVGNKEPETIFPFYLDKTAPLIASDVLGDRYMMDDKVFFSGRTKMKLTAIDNKSGVEDIYYSVNGGKFAKYDQPFYLPSIPGIHIVRYYATDKMMNNSDAGTSQYEQYKHVVSRIYVDLSGPILSYEMIGDKYKTRDTLFISGKTKIKFNSVDKESGHQYISYSINNDPDEIKYTEPLQFTEPGLKHIVYYGYDNVNNRNRAELAVSVDNEGPEIKYNFSITSKGIKDELPVYPGHVVLFLGATDQIVGAKDIYYSINGQSEKKFSLSVNGFNKASINELKIRATDYLNNETTLELKFYVE